MRKLQVNASMFTLSVYPVQREDYYIHGDKLYMVLTKVDIK